MQIDLPPELEAFVQELIASGRYHHPSEVVHDALWLLKDQYELYKVKLVELKKYLGGTTNEVIARILGRTAEEVQQQIGELRRIQQAGRWTAEEIAEFKRLYGTRTDDDLAIIFGRTLEEQCLARPAVHAHDDEVVLADTCLPQDGVFGRDIGP